jgi:hypothetical protein
MASNHPAEPFSVEIVDRGPGYLFAVYRNVFIALWSTQGTGPLVERMENVSEPHIAKHPEGFSSIQLVAKGTPLATSEARERLVAVIRKHASQFACIGTVLEGEGFWASATRSLILGMRLLVPRSFEMQTYESIDELASWLPPHHLKKTGVALDPVELARVLRGLRADLR